MKKVCFTLALLASLNGYATNSLLQNPATGNITLPTSAMGMSMVSNGTDVALALGTTGAVYLIDIQDQNPADAAGNTITSVPNFVTGKLEALAGTTLRVLDMVVNPVSKSVYVLATNSAATPQTYLFKVKSNGAAVTMVSLNNVSYSKINLNTTNSTASAVAWGNNTLYVCGTSGSGSSLAAEVNWMAPPFAHNTTFTKRATSMFKSNWGGSYMTSAPLEFMTVGHVNGKYRLMGVTTCAPGFSIDVANLSGSSALQVTEDFNVNTGTSTKVVSMKHDGKTWLYNLHDYNFASGAATLYRIGEKYIDGSQVTANKFNNNATELRDIMGNRTAGLTDNDLKSLGSVASIAFWENGKMLILDPKGVNNGALHLESMGVAPTGIDDAKKADFALTVYPNPASGQLNLKLPAEQKEATANVYGMDGRLLLNMQLTGVNPSLDISKLVPGTYSVSVTTREGLNASSVFTVK